MWLIGHTASAYVIIKCIWVILKEETKSNSLTEANNLKLVKNRKRQLFQFPAHFILLLFIFSNWPDFVHIGGYRILTHNMIAIFIIPLIVLLILIRFKTIKQLEAVLLLSASVSHMLMDVLFSDFYLLYPFQDTVFNIFAFNGAEDIVVESIITVIFLVIFVWTKEWNELSNFLSKCLIQKGRKKKSIINQLFNKYIYIIIFLLYSLFALIQLLMNFIILLVHYPIFEWYCIIFILLFSSFIGIMTVIFLKFTFNAQKMYITEIKYG